MNTYFVATINRYVFFQHASRLDSSAVNNHNRSIAVSRTEIEADKNNSSNRRPKHRSVKDSNVEGRNSRRYLSLLQY